MKKILIILLVLAMLSQIFVIASLSQQVGIQNNNDNNSSKNITNSSNKDVSQNQNANQVNVQQQTSNQGNSSNIQVQQQTQLNQNEGNKSGTTQTIQNQYQTASQTEQQVRSTVQQMSQEVNATMPTSPQNQKMAVVAVQAMEATASMFGKSEEEISQISNEIKNSFEITTRAEEQITNRSGFVKFLAGGDNEAAGIIEQQTIRNEERIRELNRLIEGSDFDPQTKAILQEQLKNIEQEQLRLKTLAEQEINNKGLLGWIWK